MGFHPVGDDLLLCLEDAVSNIQDCFTCRLLHFQKSSYHVVLVNKLLQKEKKNQIFIEQLECSRKNKAECFNIQEYLTV